MLVDRRTRSLVLQAEDPLMIRAVIPRSRSLQHPQYNVVVQHTVESTRILRNLGINAPTPLEVEYRWPGKYQPWDHQRAMAGFRTLHRRLFDLSDMGTGKSAATLWAADYLMTRKAVRKVLILAPISTMERVWMNDIFDVLMHRKAVSVHGTREQRLAALGCDVDFYVLNHDGVNIEPVREAIRRRADIDLVVVDEGSTYRNHDTNKYKALTKMLRDDQRLWWLTATPCPNAPTDAWAQARLVNSSRVSQFFGAFKRATMMQLSKFKWVPKPDGYTVAFEALQPAIRFKKSDCLTLPPVVTLERQAELTPEQLAAFKAMKQEMQMEAKSGKITAVNAADRIGKLRQILCGAIKDPVAGTYSVIPHKPRADLLKELVEQAAAKVIVIVPYKGILPSLQQALEPKWSTAIINGDVSKRRRDQIILDFKTTDQPHVLLCHPQVMAHGLNLTEADTCIFYAPIYSNDEFTQVKERFNRAGQTRHMTIVNIGAHSMEWAIYRALNERTATQEHVLNLYNSILQSPA